MRADNTNAVVTAEKNFQFSTAKRLQFYVTYILSKLLYLWHDVKAPRVRLFVYEIVYSICRAVGRPPLRLRWLQLKQVTTIFGTFNIRPGTTDAACVSPAFERPDLKHLLTLLRGHLAAGRKVLFIDVGADVGTYAISIANRLYRFGEISVLAFEPSQSSCELLCQNVADNNLTQIVEPRQVGLGDGSYTAATLRFDPNEPGCSGVVGSIVHGELREEVQMSTIDAQVNIETLPSVVALKLDVEGSEISVLRGAAATLATAQEVVLLVEDFVDTSVVSYLENTGWSFQGKFTPYNSFWTFSHQNLSSIHHLNRTIHC
jgi:FkbM family methyltransferase